MKRATSRTQTRSRGHKKPVAPQATGGSLHGVESNHVSPGEGVVTLILGMLFVVGALFPRSFKQLLLLGIGGGLVYRGMKLGHSVDAAFGLDGKSKAALEQLHK